MHLIGPKSCYTWCCIGMWLLFQVMTMYCQSLKTEKFLSETNSEIISLCCHYAIWYENLSHSNSLIMTSLPPSFEYVDSWIKCNLLHKDWLIFHLYIYTRSCFVCCYKQTLPKADFHLASINKATSQNRCCEKAPRDPETSNTDPV